MKTLLIANRGEIAVRIMRTAKRLGIRTIAVYSDTDAQALHVRSADAAYRIGPAEASESYLRIGTILRVARESGADAIHPGYGFLSENAHFARACAESGITFVGPPAEAIEAMGGKSAAKALMQQAGVPLVPGYHGDDQHPDVLATEAEKIGWPVLIKASAGGGGKGMRVVENARDFRAALDAAQREAVAAFGDAKVLIEKYLARPRHVEVQIFCDGHGNGVHLLERDCSIQRRHQKVLEEAPAPGLAPALRREMGEAAVRAAQAIDYVGAGTVEFLFEESADGHGAFYFMEMNTRLQVEHPVTEMITGQDLVEWQLKIADGAVLPLNQQDVTPHGHAVEVRLYAEDPDVGFLPATGVLSTLTLPTEDAHTRIDAGVVEGDRISIHYDPMIAKLIVWDEDRAAAVRRLVQALNRTQITGLATNLSFLRRLAGHPSFFDADLDTRFIERHGDALVPRPTPATPETLCVAALALLARDAALNRSKWHDDPWNDADGWSANLDAMRRLIFVDGEELRSLEIIYTANGVLLRIEDREITASGEALPDGWLTATLDGVRRQALVRITGEEITILLDGHSRKLIHLDPLTQAEAADGDDGGRLTAPMPGRIVRTLVEAGAEVTEGTPLIVLEAMKMEHTIRAPADGTVSDLPFQAGDQVEEGVALIGFEPKE